MASSLDYFSPGQMPAAQPDNTIMPQIASFMQNPQALSALLAFGTQAMVPQWGGGAVQFAKGVGSAGETIDKQTEDARKQQETESKAGLREAQAGAAEARANTAGTRASLTGLIEQGKTERNNLATRVRLSNLYQNYTRQTNAENALAEKNYRAAAFLDPKTPPPAVKPVLDMDTWTRNNPMLKDLGLLPATATPTGSGDEGDTLPAGATPDAASTPPAAAASGAPANPVVGQTYPSPRGPVKYLGNDRWGPP